MSAHLQGKVAVVTGGGRGLGRETALAVAGQGATVILVARHEGQLRETGETIERAGGKAYALAVDISRPEAVTQLKNEVGKRFGTVSILVNAAGVFGPIQLIKDGDPNAWVDTIAVNLFGPYFMCHAFVGEMVQQKWGRIINFTSAAFCIHLVH